MQNAFIIAFQKISQWSGEVAFGFWLRKITVNQCLDLIKKNHKQLTVESQQHVVSTAAINYDMQHDANYLLSQLPPISRSILWLYEVEGLTHQEIADMYQMSASFSKSQLSRSKQLLRNLLTSHESSRKA